MPWTTAAGQIAYACSVAERLPRTFAALAAGLIHPVHARIIEDETRILSPEDAAAADEVLAQAGSACSTRRPPATWPTPPPGTRPPGGA
jgi:hypothetical protein